MEKIRLANPNLDFRGVEKSLEEIISTGRLTSGKYVEEFERKVAALCGVKYGVATTSATTALHLSLAVLDIEEGDEVLVPDFTFPATANVVFQQKATPVLVDVDPETFAIELSDMERKITSRTKAIIPVYPFGFPIEIEKILAVAKKHNLFVIEDAATAIRTEFKGKKAGSWGTLGCFSFHPRKTITTGEGGMIMTNDEKLAEKARMLRNHGGRKTIANIYEFISPGFNYRMSEMQAALGVAQLGDLDQIIEKRKEITETYYKLLKNSKKVSLQKVVKGGKSSYQSFVVVLSDEVNRDDLIVKLSESNIETTLGTYSLHAQPYFRKLGYKAGDLPNSYRLFRQTLALPLHTALSSKDIPYVAETLNNLVG
jgi:dTDP-4-amino-4,6-dideoxygalactose transaminase